MRGCKTHFLQTEYTSEVAHINHLFFFGLFLPPFQIHLLNVWGMLFLIKMTKPKSSMGSGLGWLLNFGCCCSATKSWPTLWNWQRLPFPSLVDLPDPGIKPASPALAVRFFTTQPSGKLLIHVYGGLILSTSWTSEEEKKETLCNISQEKVGVGDNFCLE